MSTVQINVARDDRIVVVFRPDLRPDRGGTGFIDIDTVTFLLDADRFTELRDAITEAFDNPWVVGGEPS